MSFKFPLIALFAASGLVMSTAFAEEAEKLEASTCYLSSSGGVGQLTCVNDKGEASALETVAISVTDEKSGEAAPGDFKLIIPETTARDDVFGLYDFEVVDDSGKVTQTLLVEVAEAPSDDAKFEPSAYYGRGGYRGGAVYRGGGVYRGGAYYRGGAVYRGGAAVYRRGGVYVRPPVYGYGYPAYGYGYPAYGYPAAPACGYYPYPPCGGYYGGGYYGGGGYYRGGAVVVRRGGAYYRGGGVYRGPRVEHYRGYRR